MSSLVSDRDSLAGPGPAGYSKTSRRQYQACDQCRKSRRACDAGTLRVTNFPFREDQQPESTTITSTSNTATEACSNCARTSKRCTFDWLRELPLKDLPKGVKRKLESTGLTRLPPKPAAESYYAGNPTSEVSSLPQPDPVSDTFHLMQESVRDGLTQHHSSPDYEVREKNVSYHSESPEVQLSGNVDGNHHGPFILPSSSNAPTFKTSLPYAPNIVFPTPPTFERSTSQGQWIPPTFSRNDTSSTSPTSNSNDSSNQVSKFGSSPSITSVGSDPSLEEDGSQKFSAEIVHHGGSRTDYHDILATERASARRKLEYEPSTNAPQGSNETRRNSAPLSTRQVRFADTAMKAMIASGLLRIYHDSFENSLSCWVTERNCPYEVELRELSLTSTSEQTAFRLADNRIFSRVSNLDTAFARLRGRDLSPIENRTANKALNAAIMAFASQWSHGSHNTFWRSKEGMKLRQAESQGLFSQSGGPNPPLVSNEGERLIQKTLWHDARAAIQASAEIDSFKVILAYMLFALTQRPIDAKSKSSEEAQVSPLDDEPNIRQGSDAPPIYKEPSQSTNSAMDFIVDEDWDPFCVDDGASVSPPIYLEAAVRNLFSWRRKIERYRRMRSKTNDAGRGSLGALALKDQQTFNLLFWLGVMCDTTSSAITNRPLVISDEDCAMMRDTIEDGGEVWSTEDPNGLFREPQDDDPGKLWGEYLLSFKWAGPRDQPPRWPCSFEEAALVLQEAIPVKVLMFRKVATLQTLAYRRTPAHQLEKCIKDALGVYKHWNSTYGQFMIDCVNHHNNLPPHVQSWYVILDGHWHYGCLLLADMISQVDKERKTMKPQRTLRANCNLIRELRQDNAHAIANIARASLSEHTPLVPNNSEFHFACNGSAILTEPWTDILVRAMGSACKVYIRLLSVWQDPRDPNHEWLHATNSYQNLYSRAEDCIHGMTLLGRKSDAANRTAEIFWTKLRRVCSGRSASISGGVR